MTAATAACPGYYPASPAAAFLASGPSFLACMTARSGSALTSVEVHELQDAVACWVGQEADFGHRSSAQGRHNASVTFWNFAVNGVLIRLQSRLRVCNRCFFVGRQHVLCAKCEGVWYCSGQCKASDAAAHAAPCFVFSVEADEIMKLEALAELKEWQAVGGHVPQAATAQGVP